MFTESYSPERRSPYSAQRNLHHVTFFCHAPEAERVSLICDFNKWETNATSMVRQPDGRWMAGLELSHGYHHYVFLVDGRRVLDPNATGKTRDSQGQPVSLVAIS